MSSADFWRFRVEHIVDAIKAIQSYVAGLDETALAGDRKTLDAVLRNFQVIGEAARKIPTEVKQRHPELPWREMENMRHKIVHDYHRVCVSNGLADDPGRPVAASAGAGSPARRGKWRILTGPEHLLAGGHR